MTEWKYLPDQFDSIKQLANSGTDDSGKATRHWHSLILISTESISVFFCLSRQGLHLPSFSAPMKTHIMRLGLHSGGDTVDEFLSVTSWFRHRTVCPFKGTVEWVQPLWAGVQGILCLRAKSCFKVPHRNLGYSWMGVERPCERPLFVTGDSMEGGYG